ncbi:MAG: phosphoribosylaminoimidazolesuccinocarboxamide synthase [Neisseriaceae bacterium]|nr:MAG: phosphoribosylaminoimidazolesuccinocarboxamide synthase [Neisseriaceae bacterium]
MNIELEKVYSGKVRDLYQIDEKRLLMVATDRLSAFDVVFDDMIPGKGEILTQMSNSWFSFFQEDIPNHFTGESVYNILSEEQAKLFEKRAVVIKKLTPVKVEAVVRGYIAGGGWKEYQQTGMISGIHLSKGLKLAQELPEVIFTPSTKAEVGDHDESIDFQTMSNLIGVDLAKEISTRSVQLYQKASEYAKTKGIIIADTKFEFGIDENGVLTLMDEVLTPDSSRFWDINTYRVGQEPLSFDKQYIRNWLESIDWNKKPPTPQLPKEIVEQTQKRYQKIYDLLF